MAKSTLIPFLEAQKLFDAVHAVRVTCLADHDSVVTLVHCLTDTVYIHWNGKPLMFRVNQNERVPLYHNRSTLTLRDIEGHRYVFEALTFTTFKE